MSIKSRARKLGKKIRRETGLVLPAAMRAAKLIMRGRGLDLRYNPPEILKGAVSDTFFSCGPSCCGSKGFKLSGPRGNFEFV